MNASRLRAPACALATGLVAALGLAGPAMAGSEWGYDSKAMTGAQCQPSTGSQWGDFLVNPHGIRNISTSNRYISCTIPTDTDAQVVSSDNDSTTAAGQFNMQLYFDLTTITTSVSIPCTFFRRNPNGSMTSMTKTVNATTADDSVYMSSYGEAFFDGYTANDGSSIAFNCRLPSQVKLGGIWWGETGRTDGYSFTP